MTRPRRRVLPGFSLSLGYAVFYLSVLVLLPPWDPGRLSGGFFRMRDPLPWTFDGPRAIPRYKTRFYDDDPTASVG